MSGTSLRKLSHGSDKNWESIGENNGRRALPTDPQIGWPAP